MAADIEVLLIAGLRTCDSGLYNRTGRSLCSLCAVVSPGSAEAHLWQGYLLVHTAVSPPALHCVQGNCEQHCLWLRSVAVVGRQQCTVSLP